MDPFTSLHLNVLRVGIMSAGDTRLRVKQCNGEIKRERNEEKIGEPLRNYVPATIADASTKLLKRIRVGPITGGQYAELFN